MPPVQWESMFPQFGLVWSDEVMGGLPYASFIDGEERFFWIDTDVRSEGSGAGWERFRLYAPAEFLVMRDHETPITPEQFDRFFAVQVLAGELDGETGQPLQYLAQYPDRLHLLIRGERAIDTKLFEQHSLINSSGEPLASAVRALREHVVAEVDRRGLTEQQRKMYLDRISSLFPD
jgi:hypothetical protein